MSQACLRACRSLFAVTSLMLLAAPQAQSQAVPVRSVSVQAATAFVPPLPPEPFAGQDPKRVLSDLGCSREGFAVLIRGVFHPISVTILILFLLIAIFVDVHFARRNIQLNLGQRILTLGLLLAVFQWHSALEQDAMQRYESESAGANAAESSESVAHMLGPILYPGSTPEAHTNVRYVYVQLDNLEYALERYEHGFASPYTTMRAVTAFARHCQLSHEFRDVSRRQVFAASYSETVRKVVVRIASRT
jgi:hypothetical protein